MNIKIIVATFLILMLGTFIFIKVKEPQKTVINLKCESVEGNCQYTKAFTNGKVIFQKQFDFKDVMQCDLNPINKNDFENRKSAIGYSLKIYINNGLEELSFNSKNSEKMVSICTYIFEKTPFNLKFEELKVQE